MKTHPMKPEFWRVRRTYAERFGDDVRPGASWCMCERCRAWRGVRRRMPSSSDARKDQRSFREACKSRPEHAIAALDAIAGLA